MLLEALLAYVHLTAVFALVVFLSSEAALCRSEWLNAAVLRRLVRVNLIYGLSALLVLATGLLRVYWGAKGSAWYWASPLLHVKLTLFVLIVGLSVPPTLAFRRWWRILDAHGRMPEAAEVVRVRRLVMWQAHLLPLIPLAAVFLARGHGR